MRLVLAGAVVAGQRADAVVQTGGVVAQRAVQGLDVGGVEIDQVRLGGGVRVVASGAGGLIFLNMFPVITPAGSLLAVHDGTTVAFVAEGKIRRIVRRAIGQAQHALEQWGIGRAMRAIGTGTAGGGILIAVVTITTANETGGGERRDEAGHAGVFAKAFDGMERGVAGAEFQAGIGLGNLAGNPGRAARRAVAVAAETQLIFPGDGRKNPAAGIDAGDRRQRARNLIFPARRTAGGVGIMTVGTGDMADWRIHQILAGIMGVQIHRNGMDAGFFHLHRDIFPGAVAGMAVDAVFFRLRKPHQSRFGAGGMGHVTTGTGRVGHRIRCGGHLTLNAGLLRRKLTDQGGRQQFAGNRMGRGRPG